MCFILKPRYKILYTIILIIIVNPYLKISAENYPNYQVSEKDHPIQSKIIATIGDTEISEDEFKSSYEFGPAFVKRVQNSKLKHLNYMINEKLLALYGYSMGIDTTERVKETYEEIKCDLMTEELFKEDILGKIDISESEIDSIVVQKQLELEIRWLFGKNKKNIDDYVHELKKGTSFDTLYLSQFNDSVFVDDRSMFTNRYHLGVKNPELANILDTLEAGIPSKPYNIGDGWYIFNIHNIRKNLIVTESEMEKLRNESVTAIKKIKMDSLSDQYVHELMLSHNPVIKRSTFNILKSYLGKFVLPDEKYIEWKLDELLTNTIKKNQIDSYNINNQVLVTLNSSSVTLDELLIWYRSRDNYIKFGKEDVREYSVSIERAIWRMVRDRLLSDLAYERGFDKNEMVIEQLKWWKDKIVYSALKNELVNSIVVENEEISSKLITPPEENNSDLKIKLELDAKIYRLLNELRKNNKITIDRSGLEQISVTSEEDPRAIEFYTVKKGGLIPRTPYPTIDFDWSTWE